jgi:hypothetical protein
MRLGTMFFGVVLLAGTLSVGELMPRLMVSENLSRYAANPPSYVVASVSQARARDTYGSPLMRVLYPSAQVISVGVWPANCPPTAAAHDLPNREYYAQVQLYMLFGLRGPRMESRCGGTRTNWIS